MIPCPDVFLNKKGEANGKSNKPNKTNTFLREGGINL